MKMRLKYLVIRTRKTIEQLDFADTVTFLYGPVGTGKSTVARLIDYCFGGELERTPAVQKEFVAAELSVNLGEYICKIERGANDTQSVRVTWEHREGDIDSVNAPLTPGEASLIGGEVYNLSDLLFYLCGVTPIKVRQRARDPESPLIRLSFRDVWRYSYLDQTHLDSSFFRLEDPFRGRKSQDAMRFFTGLHSERLSQLESELYKVIDEQNGKREAVRQIRHFMNRFQLGSELDFADQVANDKKGLLEAEEKRKQLEQDRNAQIHPTDALRERLRTIGQQIEDLHSAVIASEDVISEQRALRAELITAKIKAYRTEHAGEILERAHYVRCPECGSDVAERRNVEDSCNLCGSHIAGNSPTRSQELEAVRRELNDRIDQIADSINRRTSVLDRSKRQLEQSLVEKAKLDKELQRELARYDSAFVESVRVIDREIATLVERLHSLERLQGMPRAINELEEEAGALQGRVDRLRNSIDEERARLRHADQNIGVIASRFKSIMLSVGFPGVSDDDEVIIDPRSWKPVIRHGDQEWGFWDAGSGGKKTLFNVCYAIAIHEAARERGMPVPNVLIIDSPTKNISDDENPELVQALYREMYRLATVSNGGATQFLLIDSDLVEPTQDVTDFTQRRMAGVPEAPSLIPYYVGP